MKNNNLKKHYSTHIQCTLTQQMILKCETNIIVEIDIIIKDEESTKVVPNSRDGKMNVRSDDPMGCAP